MILSDEYLRSFGGRLCALASFSRLSYFFNVTDTIVFMFHCWPLSSNQLFDFLPKFNVKVRDRQVSALAPRQSRRRSLHISDFYFWTFPVDWGIVYAISFCRCWSNVENSRVSKGSVVDDLKKRKHTNWLTLWPGPRVHNTETEFHFPVMVCCRPKFYRRQLIINCQINYSIWRYARDRSQPFSSLPPSTTISAFALPTYLFNAGVAQNINDVHEIFYGNICV